MSNYIEKFSGSPIVFDYPCEDDTTQCHTIEVNLTKGYWKLEVWGASGGDAIHELTKTTCIGGKGGYSVGVLKLFADNKAYLYIGGKGLSKIKGSVKTRIAGGYNGGGMGYIGRLEYPGGSGGGSTDVRIGNKSFNNRILVAGGGGSAAAPNTNFAPSRCYGGSGGGLSGSPSGILDINNPNSFASGGNQTHGGIKAVVVVKQTGEDGDFFYGGNATMGEDQNVASTSGGGGGGYFGGGGGQGCGGGGGSGYIGGVSSFLKIQAKTFTGEESFPSISDGDEQGHLGNGAVRITFINTFVASFIFNRKMICNNLIITSLFASIIISPL